MGGGTKIVVYKCKKNKSRTHHTKIKGQNVKEGKRCTHWSQKSGRGKTINKGGVEEGRQAIDKSAKTQSNPGSRRLENAVQPKK